MKKLFLLCGILVLLTGCSFIHKSEEITYCCNDGDTLTKDGECRQETIVTTDVIYTCPDGYIARGEVCYLNGERRMFATKTYSCPDGGTYINGKCRQYSTYTPTDCNVITNTKTETKVEKEIIYTMVSCDPTTKCLNLITKKENTVNVYFWIPIESSGEEYGNTQTIFNSIFPDINYSINVYRLSTSYNLSANERLSIFSNVMDVEDLTSSYLIIGNRYYDYSSNDDLEDFIVNALKEQRKTGYDFYFDEVMDN